MAKLSITDKVSYKVLSLNFFIKNKMQNMLDIILLISNNRAKLDNQ